MSDRWLDGSAYRHLLRDRIMPFYNPEASRIDYVAFKIGRKPDTLRKMLDGKIHLIPDDIPLLYNATKDIELLSWLVNRCEGLSLIKTDLSGELNGDFDDDLEKILSVVSAMFNDRRKAIKDNKLSACEKKVLLEEVRRAREILDVIENEIKSM